MSGRSADLGVVEAKADASATSSVVSARLHSPDSPFYPTTGGFTSSSAGAGGSGGGGGSGSGRSAGGGGGGNPHRRSRSLFLRESADADDPTLAEDAHSLSHEFARSSGAREWRECDLDAGGNPSPTVVAPDVRSWRQRRGGGGNNSGGALPPPRTSAAVVAYNTDDQQLQQQPQVRHERLPSLTAPSFPLLRSLPPARWFTLHPAVAAVAAVVDFSTVLRMRGVCTAWRDVVATLLWQALRGFDECRSKSCRAVKDRSGLRAALVRYKIVDPDAPHQPEMLRTSRSAHSAGDDEVELAIVSNEASAADGDADGNEGEDEVPAVDSPAASFAARLNSTIVLSFSHSDDDEDQDAAVYDSRSDASSAAPASRGRGGDDRRSRSSSGCRARRSRICKNHGPECAPLVRLVRKLDSRAMQRQQNGELRSKVYRQIFVARLLPILLPPLFCSIISVSIASAPTLREPINSRTQMSITALTVLLVTMVLAVVCFGFSRKFWNRASFPTWSNSDTGPYPAALFSYGVAVLLGLMVFDVQQWNDLLRPPPLVAGECAPVDATGDELGAENPPYVIFTRPSDWTVDREPARQGHFEWVMVDENWAWISQLENQTLNWIVPRVLCDSDPRGAIAAAAAASAALQQYENLTSRTDAPRGHEENSAIDGGDKPSPPPEPTSTPRGQLQSVNCSVPLVRVESIAGRVVINRNVSTKLDGLDAEGYFCNCSIHPLDAPPGYVDGTRNHTSLGPEAIVVAREPPRLANWSLVKQPCPTGMRRVIRVPAHTDVMQINGMHQTIVKNWDSATSLRQFLSWRQQPMWRDEKLPLVTSANTPFDVSSVRVRAYTSTIVIVSIYAIFFFSIVMRGIREVRTVHRRWPVNRHERWHAAVTSLLRDIAAHA